MNEKALNTEIVVDGSLICQRHICMLLHDVCRLYSRLTTAASCVMPIFLIASAFVENIELINSVQFQGPIQQERYNQCFRTDFFNGSSAN